MKTKLNRPSSLHASEAPLSAIGAPAPALALAAVLALPAVACGDELEGPMTRSQPTTREGVCRRQTDVLELQAELGRACNTGRSGTTYEDCLEASRDDECTPEAYGYIIDVYDAWYACLEATPACQPSDGIAWLLNLTRCPSAAMSAVPLPLDTLGPGCRPGS